nr:hypothetical protein [uncultured Pseudodesulfovibrio sp.]
MTNDGKDFIDDINLDLDLDRVESVADCGCLIIAKSMPRDLKEQHRAAKKVERGPLKNQTYTIPEMVIEELRQYVLAKKMAGDKINASRVVVEGIKLYLQKYT